MGTWGVKPHQSDDANDLLDGIVQQMMKPVHRVLKRNGRSRMYHQQARASIDVLVRLSPILFFDYDVPKLCLEALELILANETWSTWRSPSSAKAQIRREIAAVRKMSPPRSRLAI